MTSTPDLTITTACDSNYLWGVFLLVASLRQNKVEAPILVLAKDFSRENARLLEQFASVQLVPLPGYQRNLTTSKPQAMLGARSEWLAWMDSDCMAIGDLTPYLVPPGGELQIRARGEAENRSVYERHYRAGELRQGVPAHIHDAWRRDVGDLEQPLLRTTCVANVIVMNQRHRPFLELWKEQMEKVLAAGMTGLIDQANPAYHMTDESVLTSLLTFSSIAPKVDTSFLLDVRERAHVAHFGTAPKPWHRWKLRSFYWYEPVLDCLRWCAENGHQTPPLPWTFKRSYKHASHAIAALEEAALTAKRRAGAIIRAALPRPS